ncbi:MAG: fumarate reductase subunit C [Clostridia bacterium]
MKAYVRPMTGWWKRNPYYLWYLLRELSSVFVTLYALMLLWGLWRLTQGEDAFASWAESLGSPLGLAFHAVTFVLVAYHAWTWFKVMPRTMPFVRVAGRRVPDSLFVVGGVCAALAVSGGLLLLS